MKFEAAGAFCKKRTKRLCSKALANLKRRTGKPISFIIRDVDDDEDDPNRPATKGELDAFVQRSTASDPSRRPLLNRLDQGPSRTVLPSYGFMKAIASVATARDTPRRSAPNSRLCWRRAGVRHLRTMRAQSRRRAGPSWRNMRTHPLVGRTVQLAPASDLEKETADG